MPCPYLHEPKHQSSDGLGWCAFDCSLPLETPSRSLEATSFRQKFLQQSVGSMSHHIADRNSIALATPASLVLGCSACSFNVASNCKQRLILEFENVTRENNGSRQSINALTAVVRKTAVIIRTNFALQSRLFIVHTCGHVHTSRNSFSLTTGPCTGHVRLPALLARALMLPAPKRPRSDIVRLLCYSYHSPSLSSALSFSAHVTTALWWPLYNRIGSPVPRSHSRALQSDDAVTK